MTFRELFGADRQDLLALDFDFHAERWANVAALDYGPSHPDVAGKIGSFQRIVERPAARVPNQGMIGARETVIGTQLVDVGDVFQLAGTVRSFARERPIARNKRRSE